MFQGLSLDQAPPYKVPLFFYISGAVYLLLFSVLLFMQASNIYSRYDGEAIALTHAFTIGFFSHIMFGSMFQMLPVMLGLAYKNVLRNAKIIFFLLNTGVLLFIAGLLLQLTPLLHSAAALLLLSFLLFGLLSIQTVLQSKDRDAFTNTFLTSFILLIIAALFGFGALLGWSGIVDRIFFGEVHIFIMLFGWVFLLINAVSYKIIPMFFVAKEFPKIIQRYNYILVPLVIILFITANATEVSSLAKLSELLAASIVMLFSASSIYLLKKRKRARKDLSVTLWYFAMTNIIFAALVFIIRVIGVEDPVIEYIIAFFALFGGLYALINAMLYKIVPFLTWFHLSSSMVFEAEMNDVIEKKFMNMQVQFYYMAYIVSFGALFSYYFIVAGAVLFLISSLLLLRNLLKGYRYYVEYIQKAITI